MSERLKYLFELHLAQNCTSGEEEELFALALETGNDAVLKEMLEQSWNKTGKEEDMPDEKAQIMLRSILHPEAVEVSFQSGKVRKMIWRRVAVAVAILIVLGGAGYFLLNQNRQDAQIVKVGDKKYKEDVLAPTENKATLRLPNGQIVVLDTIQNGAVIAQGNKIADGELVYTNTKKVLILTLNVPRGSKPMKLTLADQTQVWLNAGSSITYPTAFVGNKREVTMTGEVYFEVERNEALPFTVRIDKQVIQVLGTHFNVNAYDDELMTRTTLLEGSIRITSTSNAGKTEVIKPGQQAQITAAGDLRIANNVDTEEVMAWKNGLFRFKGMSMEAIMRQLSRWYDVEIVYKAKIPDYGFNARISRDEPVSEMLKILELTELVHFEIEGKKVIVLE